MVYSEAGLIASMDISTTADSQNSNSSSGSSQQQHSPASPSRAAGRPSSQTGAAGAVAPRLPHSAAVNGVQALVQRGRGFIAAGSMWDVYLFDPSGATTKR
jgi:hypothetical protein